VLIDSVMGFS